MPETITHSFTGDALLHYISTLRLYGLKGTCVFIFAVINRLFKRKIIKSAYKYMRLYVGY